MIGPHGKDPMRGSLQVTEKHGDLVPGERK